MSDIFENTSGCSSGDCSSCNDCSSCGGGCGSSGDDHHTITLTMEDDTEIECAILTIYPVDAKEYIALLPLDENGQNHDGEVYLYAFTRTDSGDPILANIEDDTEYEKAARAFDDILVKAREAEELGAPLE